MNRLLDRYCRALDALSAVFLAAMVVLVFGNVVLRYAFNSGIAISEEMSRWLFVWVTFLGASVAVRKREHLGTDVVVSRATPRVKRLLCVLALVLMLGSLALLFAGSVEQFGINRQVTAPVTGFPVAVVYAAGIVFAVSAGAFMLVDLVRVLRGKFDDDALVLTSAEDEGDAAAAHAPAARRS